MNELALRQRELPSLPIEDVKKYVDTIGDAIEALKIKKNAAYRFNYDKTIIEEMERQIREYSALKVKAQLELGKRTRSFTKDNSFHGNQYGESRGVANTKKGKWDELSEIGLSHQRASEYERMAEDEETVEQYIEDALASGKAPSKNGALKAIEEKNSCIAEGQAAPQKKSRPTPVQAAAKDRDEKMTAAISRITNHEIVVEYSVDDLVSEIKANAERFKTLFETMLTVHSGLIKESNASKQIADAIDMYIIKQFEEMKGRIRNEQISR